MADSGITTSNVKLGAYKQAFDFAVQTHYTGIANSERIGSPWEEVYVNNPFPSHNDVVVIANQICDYIGVSTN